MRPNSLILIEKDGKLLVQKGIDGNTNIVFCRPPGGGIEFGEKSLDTIHREIKEEIGATLKNEKLLTVIENVFTYNGTLGHEITFLYSGDLVEDNLYSQNKIRILDKEKKFAEWVPVSDIKNGNMKIFPEETLKFL